tara:strand:+ start:1483 stop:1857 length:375 start_codon:yes stop_codon:yes gene_type:complete
MSLKEDNFLFIFVFLAIIGLSMFVSCTKKKKVIEAHSDSNPGVNVILKALKANNSTLTQIVEKIGQENNVGKYKDDLESLYNLDAALKNALTAKYASDKAASNNYNTDTDTDTDTGTDTDYNSD